MVLPTQFFTSYPRHRAANNTDIHRPMMRHIGKNDYISVGTNLFVKERRNEKKKKKK